MGKMFKTITQTWNPFTGCKWDCSYCWARRLAEGKLRKSYPNGFVPEIHPERLKEKFAPGEFVFISSMGDISFASIYQLGKIIEVIVRYPDTNFLMQTKSPKLFSDWKMPKNVYRGCTIETNRPYPKKISKAPEVALRHGIMASLEGNHKFLSIEPIMDFDLDIFSTWIYDIDPEIVEIGADNYRNNLPEPPWDKVYKLIDILTLHGIKVVEKDGLRRLNSTLSVI